jgi:hypothetical protein
MAATGCGDDGDEADGVTSPTAVAPPTAGATGTSGAERPPATGIGTVDRAIVAVLAADEGAIREMLVFQPVPCEANPVGIGGPPPCREGEADGTPVDVIAIAQCEGAFVRPDQLELAGIISETAELYAVYRAPPNYFPRGLYTVVFTAGAAAQPPIDAFEVVLDNEGVTGINFGCAEDAARLVETRGLTDAILAPQGG